MVLHLENSFAPGDFVRFGGDEGVVREIRWRQTTLESLSGSTIIVPNSALMKGTVTVLGRRAFSPRGRWSKAVFNVYYDRAPNEVIHAVQNALRDDPPASVASDPRPNCALLELKESHAVYAANYWITDVTRADTIDSAVRVRIYYALSRAGIKLSIPSRALLVLRKDEEVQERSSRLESERRLIALKGVDIFGSLTEDEFKVLADRLIPSPFSEGEVITRQGAHSQWLFIILKGEAEVRLYSEDGSSFHAVSKLAAGDFLGEMGLMTGEPRSATVIALSEVASYRLDRESFSDILLKRPAIAESISAVLAKRRVELDAARTGLSEEVKRQRIRKDQGDLLSRIRSLFGVR
jgi:CRP-like cAMP-binding protein